MGLLKPFEATPAFLKAGFLGFNKSGKTWTAMDLAIGTREIFGLKGPIAMFDTEGGSDYIGRRIQEKTGIPPVRVKSRVFDDLMTVGRECIDEGVSILIVDSITHVWRELMNAYMVRLNEALKAKGRSPKSRMDLQDIMRVKDLWAAWPDFYLNSKLHIIICGRAGFEWDMIENEDTGKKELTKTGVKMKVESEFGFEPSLLVEMERVQNLADDGRPPLLHRATVLGDRFGVIDAAVAEDPGFDFFRPHVELLLAGKHQPTRTETASNPDVDDDGNTDWAREKKQRAILCEEIQGLLVDRWPGQTAEHKKAKIDLIYTVFETWSWTKVESMESAKLRDGLEYMRSLIGASQKDEVMQ